MNYLVQLSPTTSLIEYIATSTTTSSTHQGAAVPMSGTRPVVRDDPHPSINHKGPPSPTHSQPFVRDEPHSSINHKGPPSPTHSRPFVREFDDAGKGREDSSKETAGKTAVPPSGTIAPPRPRFDTVRAPVDTEDAVDGRETVQEATVGEALQTGERCSFTPSSSALLQK